MNSSIKNTKLNKLLTKIVAAVILVSAAVCILMIFRSNGEKAVITTDSGTRYTFDLSEKNESESFEVEGAVIEICEHKIRVKSSDCPDKICVNTGYISKKGEQIVCLPKKLIIKVE